MGRTGVYDRVANIENITGSAFNDSLLGDWRDNILRGNAGSDRLESQEGNDFLYGGAGSDRLFGGAGFDVAVQSGACSSYAVQKSGNGWTVRTSAAAHSMAPTCSAGSR